MSSPRKFDFSVKDGDEITKLTIRHGDLVDSIEFEITYKDGETTTEKTIHTTGGEPTEILLGPGEHVTRISGNYAKYHGQEQYITNMIIHTNESNYGPFGSGKRARQTQPFSTPQQLQGSIIGYFGTSGSTARPYLISIGFYVKHGPYAPSY